MSNANGKPHCVYCGSRTKGKPVCQGHSDLPALDVLRDTQGAYYIVFLLVGIANAGFIIADLALVLEFAPASHRPTYMGIASGVLGPWVGLAPIIGGVLLTAFGYTAMLLASIALTAMGLLLVIARVREPRTHNEFLALPTSD